MRWNKEFRWSNRSQTTTAVILWIILGLLIFGPPVIRRLQDSSQWKRTALLHRWTPRSVREATKTRLVRALKQSDIPLLIELIEKGAESERFIWARLLFKLPSETTTRFFLVLAKDGNENVRGAALRYLSIYGDKRAVSLFLDILTSPEPEQNGGFDAVRGLDRLNETGAIAPMVKLLSHQEAPDILSDFEILLGGAVSHLANQNFDFREKCRHVCVSLGYLRMKQEADKRGLKKEMDKHPEKSSEIARSIKEYRFSEKRELCDNHGPVEARKKLLLWWGKTHLK